MQLFVGIKMIETSQKSIKNLRLTKLTVKYKLSRFMDQCVEYHVSLLIDHSDLLYVVRHWFLMGKADPRLTWKIVGSCFSRAPLRDNLQRVDYSYLPRTSLTKQRNLYVR